MATIEHLPLAALKPWPRNARTHSRRQVKQLADSLKRFGFTQPVLIDEDNHILAGHGRVRAAKELGLGEVPCLRIAHLNSEEKRAYVLADNKLALNAGWNQALLAEELKELVAKDVSFGTVAGFSLAETERLTQPRLRKSGRDDNQGRCQNAPARCKPGDVFQLGPHWLICSDELTLDTVMKLLEEESPKLLITMAKDEETMSTKAQAALNEASFRLADEAGAHVFLAEGDPRRCDQIIKSWEDRAGTTAFWCYAGAPREKAKVALG